MQLKGGNYEAAIEYFNTAVELGDSAEHRETFTRSYELLSDAFAAQGDYEQAFKYATLFHKQNQLQLSEMATTNYEYLETKHRLSNSIEHNEKLRETNLRIQTLNHALEVKNDELKMYTNIMSHDLRSPLQSIIMSSELMLSHALSAEEVKKYSKYIMTSAKSIGKLLDDLLVYSKSDLNARREPKEVDLNEVVEEAIADLQYMINELEVDLKIVNLPVVMGDRILLKIVFQNLISNALKYQPKNIPGHVANLNITGTATEEGRHVILVEDNGIGIPDEFVDKLFEPFKRYQPSEYEGTGLGMSICSRVMRVHNADIELKSSSEHGSCFQLTFG